MIAQTALGVVYGGEWEATMRSEMGTYRWKKMTQPRPTESAQWLLRFLGLTWLAEASVSYLRCEG